MNNIRLDRETITNGLGVIAEYITEENKNDDLMIMFFGAKPINAIDILRAAVQTMEQDQKLIRIYEESFDGWSKIFRALSEKISESTKGAKQ